MLRRFLHRHLLLRTAMVCLFLLGLAGNLAAAPMGMPCGHTVIHDGMIHEGAASVDRADEGSPCGSADATYAMEDNGIDDSLALPMLPVLHLAVVPHTFVEHGHRSLVDAPISSELRPPIG